jgi:hypothetical protein
MMALLWNGSKLKFNIVAVTRWSEKECERRGLEPTPDRKRFCLGDALFLPHPDGRPVRLRPGQIGSPDAARKFLHLGVNLIKLFFLRQ